MDHKNNYEFFWKGVYKSRNIFTEKFDNELEEEINFFDIHNLPEIKNMLSTFKYNKQQYAKNKKLYKDNRMPDQYVNNLKQSISTVNWIFSECKSVTKYNTVKKAISDRIILSNSLLRKKILPLNNRERAVALSDDVQIGFYYNFKLKDYIEPDMISNYKKSIDKSLIQNQKNNYDLQDSHDRFSKKISDNINDNSEILKSNIEFSTSVLDQICLSYINEMLSLEHKYHKKLQFDKPSKFWEEKSSEYKKTSKKWLVASGIVTVILLIITIFISTLIFDITWDSNLITIKMIGFSKDLTFGNVLLITAIESIIIYILKTCIKYYDYNLKLYEFYKSKAMLSSFYVTIKDDPLSENIKEKIYTQLFASSNVDFDKVEDVVLSKLK